MDVATEYNGALVCNMYMYISVYRIFCKALTTVVFLVVFHWCSCLEYHVHVPLCVHLLALADTLPNKCTCACTVINNP